MLSYFEARQKSTRCTITTKTSNHRAGREIAYKLRTPRFLVLLTLMACVGLSAPSFAAQGNGNGKKGGSKINPKAEARLNAAFDKGDTVRVIVGMASADEPDATRKHAKTPSSSQRQNRRQSIRRLQDRVLGKMSSRKQLKRIRNFPYIALEVNADELRQLQEMGEVESIIEDELLSPTLDDSAPQIGADVAWSAGYTGLGQTVAIIDTGVDSSHPNFAGKVIAEACFSTTTNGSTSVCPAGQNPNGADYQVGPGAGVNCSGHSSCSHGTHVAGIAAGSSSTYTGVAPDAYLMSVQVFSRFDSAYCSGSSDCLLAFSSDSLRALDWIYEQRAEFNIASVNLSLGGGKYQSMAECDQANSAWKVAIDNLRSVGIATAAASGNNGYTSAMIRPGCVSSAISVGGVSGSDAVASWSNSAPWLSVLAPGKSIKSSVPGTGFSNKSGTSMATPHVAGAIAAMRSADPSASVDEIIAAITATGVPVTDSRNSIVTPRLQLDAAIGALTQTTIVPQPEPEPEPEPEGSADVVLTLNSLDSNEYGWRWGDGLHKDDLTVAFESTGADLELSLTAYDMDYADEVSVYLNGSFFGNLSKGANNSLNGGDNISLPYSVQVTGENRLEFRQRSPGWKWGISNLLLAVAGNQPPPEPEPEGSGDVTLTPNVIDAGEYGWRWGDELHEAEFTVAFQSTGADFDLSVTAYDMDYSDEVSVYLNGNLLGYLSKGGNNSLNGGDNYAIPYSAQIDGENQLEFRQRKPGWIWGVTNLELSD